MSELKICPECNGQGFVTKWSNDQAPPVLHKCECVRCGGSGSVEMSQGESVKRLADAFGADIVIPVRCRDCIHQMGDGACCVMDQGGANDGFCSYGERKDA